MAQRQEYQTRAFEALPTAATFPALDEWLNEQAQYQGELLATESTSNLANNATTYTAAAADPGLNTGRKVRFRKGTFQELDTITAVTLTVTVTRGASPVAHALGAAVLDSDGEQVGVLSAQLDNSATTFTMTAVDKAFVVGAALTIDDETVTVTTLASALTFARPSAATQLDQPFEIRDDNGPYSLDTFEARDGRMFVVVQSDN